MGAHLIATLISGICETTTKTTTKINLTKTTKQRQKYVSDHREYTEASDMRKYSCKFAGLSFYLNGHNLKFHSRTQKFRTILYTITEGITRKNCSEAFRLNDRT